MSDTFVPIKIKALGHRKKLLTRLKLRVLVGFISSKSTARFMKRHRNFLLLTSTSPL